MPQCVALSCRSPGGGAGCRLCRILQRPGYPTPARARRRWLQFRQVSKKQQDRRTREEAMRSAVFGRGKLFPLGTVYWLPLSPPCSFFVSRYSFPMRYARSRGRRSGGALTGCACSCSNPSRKRRRSNNLFCAPSYRRFPGRSSRRYSSHRVPARSSIIRTM
jgi:hypothetical protein